MSSEGFATLANTQTIPAQQLLAQGPPKGGRRTRKNNKHGGAPDMTELLQGAKDNGLLGGGNAQIGSKAEVFHGKAQRTSGGLTRKDLVMNKRGRIVSLKQQAAGKKAFSRLVKAGYKPKKGTFKLFKRKD